MKRIPLAKWTPDLFGLANFGQTEAKNVYATGSGYAPIKDMSAISTALDSACLGAYSAIDSNGATNTFAGDTSKLYLLTGGTFGDVSKSGGYSVGTTEHWEFAQFGSKVIATQIGNPVQYFDLSSSSAFADLDDLGDTPPQSRYVCRIRDFLMLANTTTSANQLVWSGFNNIAQWTAGTNQSDTQTLPDGGWIQGIVGGEVGYIFQDNQISRLTYVGPPVIFQIDLLETNRGLAAPGSLIKVGTVSYFLDHDGFYAKDGDSPSVSIGNQRVDNWFQAHLEPNTLEQITASFDPVNKLIFWSFVSTDATDTSKPDTILIYSWFNKEWSYAKLVHEMIFPALSEETTLEQVGAIYPIIEDVPVSLDSRTWTGGAAYTAVFNQSHKLCALAGSNLAALVTTGDAELAEGRRSMVVNARPLTDSSSATVTCQSRERFADSTVSTTAAAMQNNGDCPLMSSGRYHRMEVDIPAGATWTFVNGVDVEAVDDGEQ